MPPAAAPDAEAPSGFAVRYRDVTSSDRVRALTVLPGERVTLEVVESGSDSNFVARSATGPLVPAGAGSWVWTAPAAPGLYPLQVIPLNGGNPVTVQAFVVVPYDRLQGELLNGYRIGRYPGSPPAGLAGYGPPAGFVEVTPENENVQVSPRFRLGQFLCKQPAGSRKYVVLDERLLLALEDALDRVNEAGHRASTFHIMSGYRTPAYNRSIGNVRYSQHQWGTAADIFIDENGDGVMDDLNGDGLSDVADAEVLYRLLEGGATRTGSTGLIGGLSKYPPTAAHGPFVHVDVRDHRARW